MKAPASASWKAPLKFRMPTAENLVPIKLDIEVDGQRYNDAFTWNPYDSDSELVMFAKRTVKDLKLAPGFIPQIVQSIQSQLADFRSYEGQDMYAGDKIVPIKLDLRVNHTVIRDQFLWDLNNFESDPEEFARILCKDLGIQDPEVGPAIAFAIREQLYEIAIQNVTSARENRINKKGRRGAEYFPLSKAGGAALDLMKLFNFRSSVVRKRKEWDYYKPILDLLSNEDVDALEAKEERSVMKRMGTVEQYHFLQGFLAYCLHDKGIKKTLTNISREDREKNHIKLLLPFITKITKGVPLILFFDQRCSTQVGSPLVVWYFGGSSGNDGRWSSTNCIESEYLREMFGLMELRFTGVEQK
ncbi:hypothetical protein CRYUN_Cryun09bG0075800 [Craigia yunnanensis]